MARQYKKLPYTTEDIQLFTQRYSSGGGWATQNNIKEIGKSPGWTPGQKTPLTEQMVRDHLEGRTTYGSYLISPSSTCKQCVIDFDVSPGAHKAAALNPDSVEAQTKFKTALRAAWDELMETRRVLMATCQLDPKSLVIDFSGAKGYHITLFFSEEIPSVEAFTLGRTFCRLTSSPKREVYPLQPIVTSGGLGSLIKIPWGTHKKTGERCALLTTELDKDGDPIQDMDAWNTLRNCVLVTPEQVRNINKLGETEETQVDGFAWDPDFFAVNGNMDKMLESCQALKSIVDFSKTPDDTGIYNVGHQERIALMTLLQPFREQGLQKINSILSFTHNYDEQKTTARMTEKTYTPTCCTTLQARGICKFKKPCTAIAQAGGKSPIKLSLTAGKKYATAVVLSTLGEIENPLLSGLRVTANVSVPALVDTPYSSMKKVVYKICTPETCPKYKECGADPTVDAAPPAEDAKPKDKKTKTDYTGRGSERDIEKSLNFGTDNPIHIEIIGMPGAKLDAFYKSKYGCLSPKHLQKVREEKIYVQQLAISSCLSSVSRVMSAGVTDTKVVAKEAKDYMAYALTSDLQSSRDYKVFGTIVANPLNQQVTMLISSVEPLQGTVDSFEVTPENQHHFDALKKLTIKQWLDEFDRNITCIHGRDSYVMAVLLTYFSVMELTFNKVKLNRAHVETAIIGDTGMAKSAMIRAIMNHIGVGYIESSNSTVAGLIGGCDKIGNRNYLKWGAFPRCNGNLLFLDEIQLIPKETWMQLRQIRSDGFAKISKIVSGTAQAKVRLLVAMNPMPNDRAMADFARGACSLSSVMDPADIRRFDMAVFLSKDDLDQDYVNIVNTKEDTILTSDMIKCGLLWTWSRKNEEIIFSTQVELAILKSAKYLANKFGGTSAIPLCNSSDMREKLARLVAAVAGLLMHTPDFVTLNPTLEDVNFITKFLDDMYSHKNVALDLESTGKIQSTEMNIDQYEAVISECNSEKGGIMADKGVREAGFPIFADICEKLSKGGEHGVFTVASWVNIENSEANRAIAILTQNQLATSGRGGCITATTRLNRFLRIHKESSQQILKGLKGGATTETHN